MKVGDVPGYLQAAAYLIASASSFQNATLQHGSQAWISVTATLLRFALNNLRTNRTTLKDSPPNLNSAVPMAQHPPVQGYVDPSEQYTMEFASGTVLTILP
jgi:hypothetical protein